jgi:hypothetical protein
MQQRRLKSTMTISKTRPHAVYQTTEAISPKRRQHMEHRVLLTGGRSRRFYSELNCTAYFAFTLFFESDFHPATIGKLSLPWLWRICTIGSSQLRGVAIRTDYLYAQQLSVGTRGW